MNDAAQREPEAQGGSHVTGNPRPTHAPGPGAARAPSAPAPAHSDLSAHEAALAAAREVCAAHEDATDRDLQALYRARSLSKVHPCGRRSEPHASPPRRVDPPGYRLLLGATLVTLAAVHYPCVHPLLAGGEPLSVLSAAGAAWLSAVAAGLVLVAGALTLAIFAPRRSCQGSAQG